MIMYKIKCLENRVKVFKDGVEYIEMDVVTTCKNFLADHQELLDALERGKQYRLNKVGELVKNDKGQLSLW